LRQSKHWEFLHNPDVLILPSRLGALAKDVNGSVIVNPGQLTKGIGGGSYAQMTIHPVKESEIRDAALANREVPHNIFARSNISIVKI
jgi:DNA polymerase alpha subunit B